MTNDSTAPASPESVEKRGVVSGPPTESGECDASKAPEQAVWPKDFSVITASSYHGVRPEGHEPPHKTMAEQAIDRGV